MFQPPALAALPGRNGKIAFSIRDSVEYSDSTGLTPHLAVMSAAAGRPRVIARALPEGVDGFFSWPAFSPTGSTLALSTTRIELMRPDRSVRRKVTTPRGSGDDYAPSWSPSGRRIAFYRVRCGGGACWSRIYTIRPDGTGPRLVDGRDPSWSSRGDRL